MGPRKRSKPNPKAEPKADAQVVPGPPAPPPQERETSSSTTEDTTTSGGSTQSGPAQTSGDGPNTPQFSKAWYGGSWPRKATPVTQVAKESISAAGGAASEAVASARARTPRLPTTPLKSPTLYLSRSMGSSSRSLPLAATTTKLNITTNNSENSDSASRESQAASSVAIKQKNTPQPDARVNAAIEKAETSPSVQKTLTEDQEGIQAKEEPSEAIKTNRDSGSWLNWFSKNEIMTDNDHTIAVSASHDGKPDEEIEDSHKGMTTEISQDADPPATSPKHRRNSEPSPVSPKEQQEIQPRSWLGLWGNASNKIQSNESLGATRSATPQVAEPEEISANKPQSEVAQDAESDLIASSRPPPAPANVGKSYGWAFWSKDQSKDEDGQSNTTKDVGELAQAGSMSESRPEDAVVEKAGGIPNKVEKRQRPQSLVTSSDIKKMKKADETSNKNGKKSSATVAASSQLNLEVNAKAKRIPENLLLPSFKQTYSVAARPSLIQQISRLLQMGSLPITRHLARAQSPHRIKKALAIGVHGYFPAPLVRSVLGQPTGTSIRFANSAANAIQKWAEDQNYSCEIEKVALEGEGRIAERIDLLWKLMLNWIEKIRKADFVMIACHSQGVPVAMILVAKLIAFGCVHSAKIGVCAMAGVNLGPFADYKSRWISGSAGELFEFAQPDSRVTKDYETALDEALRFGVKIVYVGSIDDQLVSLESSTFGTISHPNVYRAVFVDGRIHAPDFLSHLVGFALKLRNLGVSDHGLIRELSTPLAGSLYTGEGHSRIYDDEAVYYLAVQHALETTSTFGSIPLQTHRAKSTTTQNPYILPFAMRGLLEENYVRSELHGEITELIKQFDDWKPSSKVLKDVKFRLEGVRSKL